MVKLKYRELVKGHNRWVDILTLILTVVLIPVSLGATAFFIVSAGAFGDVPNAGVGIPYFVGLTVMGFFVLLAYFMNGKIPVWFNKTKRCDIDYDPYDELHDELKKKHEAKMREYDELFDDMKRKYEIKSREYDELIDKYARDIECKADPIEETTQTEEARIETTKDPKIEETENKDIEITEQKKVKKQPKNKSKKTTRKSSKNLKKKRIRDKKGKFVQAAEEEEETPDDFMRDMATASV